MHVRGGLSLCSETVRKHLDVRDVIVFIARWQ